MMRRKIKILPLNCKGKMFLHTVTFGERMKKRYKVTTTINTKNDRGIHVETPENSLTGKTFALGKRSVTNTPVNVAVMYQVLGVNNGNRPAHLTAYFGPLTDAQKY